MTRLIILVFLETFKIIVQKISICVRIFFQIHWYFVQKYF